MWIVSVKTGTETRTWGQGIPGSTVRKVRQGGREESRWRGCYWVGRCCGQVGLKFTWNPQEIEIVPARDGKIGVFIHQHLPLIGWGMALQVLSPQYRLLCAQAKQASVALTLVGPRVLSKSQAADTDAWDGGCHHVTGSVHCSWGELRDQQWGHGQSVISAIVE